MLVRSTVTLTALLIALGSCATPSRPADDAAVQDGSTVWPFWPTSMRVHPLTRVTTDPDDGGPILEARIEFLDRDGITSRASGLIQIELLGAAGGPEAASWTVDLTSLTNNATHFDDITRTYLFRLGIDESDLQDDRVLRVTFFGAEGREFEARKGLSD